ncbi:hypothetical protein B0H13DRAFT_513360 [Mycena leptocephala]|nr:hypothetical protein B0H13DRAFT_513360 [Mycena leptocephala]
MSNPSPKSFRSRMGGVMRRTSSVLAMANSRPTTPTPASTPAAPSDDSRRASISKSVEGRKSTTSLTPSGATPPAPVPPPDPVPELPPVVVTAEPESVPEPAPAAVVETAPAPAVETAPASVVTEEPTPAPTPQTNGTGNGNGNNMPKAVKRLLPIAAQYQMYPSPIAESPAREAAAAAEEAENAKGNASAMDGPAAPRAEEATPAADAPPAPEPIVVPVEDAPYVPPPMLDNNGANPGAFTDEPQDMRPSEVAADPTVVAEPEPVAEPIPIPAEQPTPRPTPHTHTSTSCPALGPRCTTSPPPRRRLPVGARQWLGPGRRTGSVMCGRCRRIRTPRPPPSPQWSLPCPQRSLPCPSRSRSLLPSNPLAYHHRLKRGMQRAKPGTGTRARRPRYRSRSRSWAGGWARAEVGGSATRWSCLTCRKWPSTRTHSRIRLRWRATTAGIRGTSSPSPWWITIATPALLIGRSTRVRCRRAHLEHPHALPANDQGLAPPFGCVNVLRYVYGLSMLTLTPMGQINPHDALRRKPIAQQPRTGSRPLRAHGARDRRTPPAPRARRVRELQLSHGRARPHERQRGGAGAELPRPRVDRVRPARRVGDVLRAPDAAHHDGRGPARCTDAGVRGARAGVHWGGGDGDGAQWRDGAVVAI